MSPGRYRIVKLQAPTTHINCHEPLSVDYYLAVDCGYSETLYETGITVPTTMSTSYIRIDTVIKTGDGRLGQNGLCKDLFDFH